MLQDYRTNKLTALHSNPRDYLLAFDIPVTVGPMAALLELSDEGRALFTEALLRIEGSHRDWKLRHTTRTDAYPIVPYESAYLWLLRREGRLRTSLGSRPPKESAGPQLRQWSCFLPVADCTEEQAKALKLPASLQELSDAHWSRALTAAACSGDDLSAGRFYAAACPVVPAPPTVRARIGDDIEPVAPASVTVASEPGEAQTLKKLDFPFILVSGKAEADLLVEHWKLQPADRTVAFTAQPVPSGAPTPLGDRFPGLHAWLSEEQRRMPLVPCSSLRIEYATPKGKIAEVRSFFVDGETAYFSDTLSHDDLLDEILRRLDITLTPDERAAVLTNRELAAKRARLVKIASQPNLAAKLLAAVGPDALRRRLPEGLIAAAEHSYGKIDGRLAARLALAVYGVEALRTFREDLAAAGLQTPVNWAGSYSARAFVKELGFPPEYAGFEQARLSPSLDVEGPHHLPDLHDFQNQVAAKMRTLLLEQGSKRRGVLSLPTGAGKTRVAVETITKAVNDDGFKGPILWIAQTEELCEQAVQTWYHVWRAVGPGSRLRISRLWSGNEAVLADSGTQVVVATTQKLTQGCIEKADYAWLKRVSCVVVDEAHLSTEGSYTAVLDWLGLSGRLSSDRCPVIGLTATPFRGNESETDQLVARYRGNRLDKDVFPGDPYVHLQQLEVISQVDHELLKGTSVRLSEEELAHLKETQFVPASVNERIGADAARNKVLLDSIRRHPPDWPILLFAASVDHAQTMAALLVDEDISAAAISGQTDVGARRHYIRQFREGKLRVLTNYAVLTVGFDAPSIRAVYVARPTYSPVRYQQMIGRGLRGPKNGGKERCLIVNVEDNIEQYGLQLAFTRFEYLWDPSKR